MSTTAVFVVLALSAAGCGKGAGDARTPLSPPIGQGPAFHPPALSDPVIARQPIDGLNCEPAGGDSDAAHLELFAHQRAVIVSAGVGIAPPQIAEGPHVRGGACEYPLRTHEPTGVVEFAATRSPTVGELFDIWGQPFSATQLLSFTTPATAPVQAFVNGVAWAGDVRLLPLTHHAEVVIEIGGYVTPHLSYRFPAGR